MLLRCSKAVGCTHPCWNPFVRRRRLFSASGQLGIVGGRARAGTTRLPSCIELQLIRSGESLALAEANNDTRCRRLLGLG